MKHKRLSLFLKVLLIILVFAMFSSCQSKASVQVSPTLAKETSEPIQLTNTPTSIRINQGSEIIKQIKQIASAYNQFVEDQKKIGDFKAIVLPDGTDGFQFTGNSYQQVQQQELLTQKQIQELNNEYYVLYEQGKPPTPTATFFSQEEQQARLNQLQNELQAWMSNELNSGTTALMYSVPKMTYRPFLIGESYAKEQERIHEINTLRLSANMPPANLIELDIQQIQRIEPNAIVTLKDIDRFPYYRSDIKLTTYETSTTIYNVYSQTHQFIEILPKQMPDGVNATSTSELEQKAKAMIAKFSPDANLNNLTATYGEKVGNYFFRWEDRTKPVLDDGTTYPFVQIGLNGNGELLNYYDTLPLAR